MVFVPRDARRRNVLFNHRHDLVKNGQALWPSFALPVPTIDWLSALFLVVFGLLKYVENLREVQHDGSVNCESVQLQRNDRDGAIQEPNYIKESGSDLFSNNDGAMIVSWKSLPLDVPVLDRPNDVARIQSPKHYLDLVSKLTIRVVHEESIRPPLG